MSLPRRDVKAGGVAQRIDRGVHLGAQAATATRNGLALFRPPFFSPGAVLVGLGNGRVDQKVFVVRILRQGFEDALPDAPSAPVRMAQVHDAKDVCEALTKALVAASVQVLSVVTRAQPVVWGGTAAQGHST